MTIAEALQAMTGYPIAAQAIANMAEEAGLNPATEATPALRGSAAYRKAQALVYTYLVEAPNISQSGISYTFSADERQRFARRASAIFKELGESDPLEILDIECGYIGEDF